MSSNPSVKRDWPMVAFFSWAGNVSPSGFGQPALRPAPYFKR